MWDLVVPGKPYRLVTYVLPKDDAKLNDGYPSRNRCSRGVQHFSSFADMLSAARRAFAAREALVFGVIGWKHTGDGWTEVGVLQ